MKKSKWIPAVVYIVMGAILLFSVTMALFGKDNLGLSKKVSTNEKTNTLHTSSEEKSKDSNDTNKRIVAYFTSWSAYEHNVAISDIDASLITHLNYAFANVNSDGKVVVGDNWADLEKDFGNTTESTNFKGDFGQLQELKKKNPELKTLISIGGFSWSNQFSDVAADEGKRKEFAISAAEFVSQYGFDGVDIDWEYPVEGNEIPHRPEDKQNYTKLIKETREALDEQGKKEKKTYLLSIAGGANITFTQNTELKEMMKYLDYINLMTYDYHGTWEQVTNHNTPLYSNPNDTTESKSLSIDDTIQAYVNAGVKPQDLNLGLAFYGRGWIGVTNQANNGLWQPGQAPVIKGFACGTWEAGVFDYSDIKANYVDKYGYQRYWDDVAKVPYLYNGNSFISYDDEESLSYKLKYADEKGLGGAMFWEFSADKEKTLQKVIATHYNKKIEENEQVSSQQESSSSVLSSEELSSQPTTQEGDTWNPETAYQAGEIVVYQGKQYSANWWNQGTAPDPNNQWGTWKLIE